MKKALISPNELVGLGCRVAEVCDTVFPVAEPMFWADCPDEVVADLVYYNKVTDEFLPIPAVEPAPAIVPESVTAFQAQAALQLAGLLDTVIDYINQPSTPVLTKLAWDKALHFERHSPMVTTIGTELGLTEQELDNLFIQAATIK